MDFLNVITENTKNGINILPDFSTYESKDLMIRGSNFYAVWDEENKVWSKSEFRCVKLIDDAIRKKAEDVASELGNVNVYPKYLKNSRSGSMSRWKDYIKKLSIDNFVPLDSVLVFSNTEKSKELYSSHSLPYALVPGDYSAYDELISVLYSPEERDKLEWIIGSIVAGASKDLQKFAVLTGDAGTGKSTVIKIVNHLFDGYCQSFNASILGNAREQFPLESLKENPMVAYDNETNLSDITSNTTLNSLIAHEPLVVNSKYSKKFTMRFSTMLLLCSNEEVKITNARSGLQRRLIDIRPTGKILPTRKYNSLMKQIDFELGAIAWHCKEVFESDPEKYLDYRPSKTIRATNYTYNFLEENYYEYKDGVTLKRLWSDYKKYCEEAGIKYILDRLALKQEATAYFREFLTDTVLDDGSRVYSYFRGIRPEKFGLAPKVVKSKSIDIPEWLQLKEQHSLLDDVFKDFPAQYAKVKDGQEIPSCSWDKCKTTLKDIDTSKVHYVLPDDIYVELDFDLKNEKGEKDYERNIRAVMDIGLPSTYVETSKGGQGLHLIYIYNGDVSRLAFLYDENIEVKVHLGKASMRRRVTKCNDISIRTITSGLPLKGGKKMLDDVVFRNEKHLRRMIFKNLRKEILPATKPSMDLIYKDLEKAYNQGLHYDVEDLRNIIFDFAMNSTHQSDYCVELITKMKFKSDDISDNRKEDSDAPIVFFDTEVYKNLFVLCYKYLNVDDVVKLINPDSNLVEALFKYRLIGFNNRRYDNHILWAYTMGYRGEQLYNISQSIINGDNKATFGEAYNLSYTDVWDFASNKQSLKLWEIQLGVDHMEMDIPWDEPAPEDRWEDIADYCANDVRATEAVFLSKEGQADFKAREILADIAGMTVNDTTNKLTLGIVFGKEKHPVLEYTDLSKLFPGYKFEKEFVTDDKGKTKLVKRNMYRGTDVGFGGYVYAKPGMYKNVALLDVASMHPTSIIELNKLGSYTKIYSDLKQARVCIKHGDYDSAKKLFDGKLAKYLTTKEDAKNLSKALKLPLNSFYGISYASFENPARDPLDENNIIALRGALFMRTLQDEVEARHFTVAHIKTDSIKIPEATPEIIEFVTEFGKKYGYEFEHEATYAKMCLVNGSTYVAKYDEHGDRTNGGIHANEWTATAAQFQIPFVFKTLFSHEPLIFDDFCETKSVKQGALYLDFVEEALDGEHNYRFIGRVGRFCPVLPGNGGGVLLRRKDGKDYAATGTKGYLWLESEVLRQFTDWETIVDRSYYLKQVDQAVIDISEFGDFEWFVSDGVEEEKDYCDFDKVDKDPLAGLMNPPEELPWN